MRPALLCLLLFLPGCRSQTRFKSRHLERTVSDGVTLTAVVAESDITASSSPLEHGSRYDREVRRTGLIQWKLPDGAVAGGLAPARVIYLGKETAIAQGESGADIPPPGFEPYVCGSMILHVDIDKGALALRDMSDLKSPASVERSIDSSSHLGGDIVYSRSGRHAWTRMTNRDLIYSTADLRLVKEPSTSPGFRGFNARFKGEECWTRILTDDARFLIKVPFNAGRGQGGNHDTVVLFDSASDQARQVVLGSGVGETVVYDADVVEGTLLFLAQLGGELTVCDESSAVLARLPSEKTRHFNFRSNTYWDPTGKRFVVWDVANLKSWGPIQVVDHDYGRSRTLRYDLTPGNAEAVILNP